MSFHCVPAVTLKPGELIKLDPGLLPVRVVSIVQRPRTRLITLRVETHNQQVHQYRMKTSTPVLVEEKGTAR